MSPRRIAKALAGFGAVALAALIGVTVYVVRNRPGAAPAGKIAGLVPNALLHAGNFHWTQMKAGVRQWVLTARDASYSADRTSLLLKRPRLSMTSSDGKDVVVEAPRAALILDGNRIKRADLTGGTKIFYGDFALTTEEAVFRPDADEVEAPGQVTIEGEGLKVVGTGLTGHPRQRQFELLRQVSTRIAPKRDSDRAKRG